MEQVVVPSLLETPRAVPDPREARGQRSRLATVLPVAVCGMRSGARSLDALAQWRRQPNAAPVRAALGLPHTDMPSVATLLWRFRDLDREAFERALAGWVRAPLPRRERRLAVEGTTLPGRRGAAVPGVHLVAAFMHGSGRVLGPTGGASATLN